MKENSDCTEQQPFQPTVHAQYLKRARDRSLPEGEGVGAHGCEQDGRHIGVHHTAPGGHRVGCAARWGGQQHPVCLHLHFSNIVQILHTDSPAGSPTINCQNQAHFLFDASQRFQGNLRNLGCNKGMGFFRVQCLASGTWKGVFNC